MPIPAHLQPERVVAFIDILGFADLIKEMPEKPDVFNLVRDTLKEVQTRHTQMAESISNRHPRLSSNPVLQFAHFSDSIVITASIRDLSEKVAAELIVILTSLVVVDLFKRGILVRGGIARGWTFHNSEANVLFGEGVIEAYQLEKQSHVPRVMIADNVVKLLNPVSIAASRIDSDSSWYINLFNPKDKLSDAEKRIRTWLTKYKDRSDVLPKYRWVATLYNAVLKEWSGVRWTDFSPVEGASSIDLNEGRVFPPLVNPPPPRAV